MPAGRLQKFLAAKWSFIGVVFFFTTHGYSRNLLLVPIPALLLLLLALLIASTIIFLLAKWVLKSSGKASLFTSFFCFVVLFFSVYQEFFDSITITSSLTKLRILAPGSLLAVIIVFILLKRSKTQFRRVFIYLNLLLLIYIIIDLAVIAYSLTTRGDDQQKMVNRYGFVKCDTCSKPPVYLILLDSYFGSEGLKQYYNYDNSVFEDHLRSEKFHVSKTTNSNYLNTLFSMASMLNMEYLPRVPGVYNYKNHEAFTMASTILMDNKVNAFFKGQGYSFSNLSFAEIRQGAAASDSELWPDKIHLITRQTLFYQVSKYLPGMLQRNGWISTAKREEQLLTGMEKLMQTALDKARDSAQPSFTYLHLMMPHDPYLFDSTGIRWRDKKPAGEGKYNADERFLHYQVYVNKKIGTYISALKRLTGGNTIILLMSDHGYPNARVKDRLLPYSNLNAVYLPNGNYSGWYDGMSNVNQFRVLFNTQFGQKLPMLTDSIGD